MNFKNVNLKTMAALAVLAFGAMSCGNDDDNNNPQPQQNVLQLAQGNSNVLSGTTQITVFAPTDAAFVRHLGVADEAAAIAAINAASFTAAQAADLLTYHVISGSEVKAANIQTGTNAITTARASNNRAFVTKTGNTVTVNNATVTQPDVDASNGVVHVIDAVLTPPTGDVVATATSTANAATFNILAAAVTKAGLVPTLQGNGPFTVFAPTDDAFLALLRSAAFFNNANLTEAQVLDYINNTISATSTPLNLPTLTQVLQYHVVSGAAYSINLTNNQSLTTVKPAAPNTLTVAINGTTVTIDGSASQPATVTTANLTTSNGVIHVINGILLP
ncbi:MAG: fasciclin domain-containing protein [Cytophagales bacterium]|nr:fasciclin domain-containing protein [Cytophagales bacterium]